MIYREPEELPEELAPPEEEEEEDEDEDPYPPELEELMPGCWLLFTPGLAPGAIGALGAVGTPGVPEAVAPPLPPPPPADCAVASMAPPPMRKIDPISAVAFKLEARIGVP